MSLQERVPAPTLIVAHCTIKWFVHAFAVAFSATTGGKRRPRGLPGGLGGSDWQRLHIWPWHMRQCPPVSAQLGLHVRLSAIH